MKRLLCKIYRSSREQELYLYMDKNASLEDLPSDLQHRLGKVEQVMILLITPEKKLARVKATQVLDDIANKGYFLQLPPTFNPNVVSFNE